MEAILSHMSLFFLIRPLLVLRLLFRQFLPVAGVFWSEKQEFRCVRFRG
jgi:hypothetical protein